MTKQNFNVNKLRVAAPCSVGWETMTGDERVRHCHSCQLNIYNTSAMTKSEVEKLLSKNEERICIRLYRRVDGTILTKNCSVGIRAYRRKIGRLVGATLSAILGLFSVSFAQQPNNEGLDASKIKIAIFENQTQESVITGIITDQNGATIPFIDLKLYKKGEKKFFTKGKSNKDGIYVFKKISAGLYILEAKSRDFDTQIKNFRVEVSVKVLLDFELNLKSKNVTVGIYVKEPLIDATSSSITTNITREIIDKLPH